MSAKSSESIENKVSEIEESTPKAVRITEIAVKNLFSVFNHAVALNPDEGLTIVHGPNGYGKTALLRILHSFFEKKWRPLIELPYDMFIIRLNTSAVIEIRRERTQHRDSVIMKERYGRTKVVYRQPRQKAREYELPTLEQLDVAASSLFYHTASFAKFAKKEQSESIPDWLREVIESIKIRFIQTDRLLAKGQDPAKETTELSVKAYSNAMLQMIKTAQADYARHAQSLDASFPHRLLNLRREAHLTDEEINRKLDSIKATQDFLADVGLLEKESISPFSLPSKVSQQNLGVLSVYVQDVEEKLEQLVPLAKKFELFKEIINSRFSYKQLSIFSKYGLIFIHSPQGSPVVIETDFLSSGEQHELIMAFELLFNTAPGTLVIIDEPEISLHVDWQLNFIRDLRKIQALAGFTTLLATHSPQLINDNWELTVALEGPKQ